MRHLLHREILNWLEACLLNLLNLVLDPQKSNIIIKDK